jgi:hypothetical protein
MVAGQCVRVARQGAQSVRAAAGMRLRQGYGARRRSARPTFHGEAKGRCHQGGLEPVLVGVNDVNVGADVVALGHAGLFFAHF